MREEAGSMSIIETPRRPSGAPDGRGGEWSPRARTAPEDTLIERGSFAFPPVGLPKNVEEYTAWWEDASGHITDRTLSNAMHAFGVWRQGQIDAAVRSQMVWADEGDKGIDKHVRKIGVGSIEGLNAQRRQTIVDQANAALPPEPSPIRMRTILKAHQIGEWRGVLATPEDEQKALEYAIDVAGQAGNVIGIRQYYRTEEWANRAFTETDLAVADGLARLAAIEDQRDGFTAG